MEPGFREGLGLQRSEETLWGSRINWTCRKEQNLDKEKREESIPMRNGERKRIRVEMK